MPKEPNLTEKNADKPISERNATRVMALLHTYGPREQLVLRAMHARIGHMLRLVEKTAEALQVAGALYEAMGEMHERAGTGPNCHPHPLGLLQCLLRGAYLQGLKAGQAEAASAAPAAVAAGIGAHDGKPS